MSRIGAAAGGWIAGALLGLAVVVAVGWLPTRRLAGEPGLLALAAGCAVAFAGSALGAAPILLALAAGGGARTHTVAARAMAFRAGGTLAGIIAIGLGTGIARTPFLVWVGVAYLALLVVETRWTLRWLAAGERPKAG